MALKRTRSFSKKGTGARFKGVCDYEGRLRDNDVEMTKEKNDPKQSPYFGSFSGPFLVLLQRVCRFRDAFAGSQLRALLQRCT